MVDSKEGNSKFSCSPDISTDKFQMIPIHSNDLKKLAKV